MFEDYDLELGLEQLNWAVGAGLTGFSAGGPWGAVAGIAFGSALPVVIDYWEGDPAPATAIPVTEAAMFKAFEVVDEIGKAEGFTLDEIEAAKGIVVEVIWNYSTEIADYVGYGMNDGGSFNELFKRASAKLLDLGTDYVDFFKSLYEKTSAQLEASKAAATPPDTSGGLWPKRPKPAPPVVTPPPALPTSGGIAWGVWIVGLVILALVAAVVMKLKKK